MTKEGMEQIKDLIRNGDTNKAKEVAELELLEKGYIKTDVFGWVTKKEFEWLNAQLRLVGSTESADTLTEIPTKQVTDRKGNIVSVISDFIMEFEDKREAINNDGFTSIK